MINHILPGQLLDSDIIYQMSNPDKETYESQLTLQEGGFTSSSEYKAHLLSGIGQIGTT